MSKVQLHDHTGSYQAITTKSPQGLQCLKRLFLEYDNANPSRANLNSLFSRDFTDNENESERNIGRDEAIQTIISTRAKCSRHQIDLKRATCLVNSGSSHTVFFEGVRFMMFAATQEGGSDAELPVVEDKSDWTRVPFAGRIEVRVKENKFSLKEAVAEIVSRRVTSDNSMLIKRDLMSRTNSMPLVSPGESPLARLHSTSTSQIGLPTNVSELPAAISAPSGDTKSLPPYRSSATGTPTVTSGSSVDGDQSGKR
ncbi:uncharacterized protein Z519_08707 [Cladophialophora bantiana CBS 173.52]|uniref:Uncharacterized protein n=1 Tax=Cladophialophora bantiana (strain ATCC 10958 / CBS 173.52 / CDC B-1940 / NIH 8579) TaxID=1442370 RepID=A0A0D2I218_CLAB1|nr:uncharacterized protein Z519_08707 [Cladophialophora bantiana CBS 173.52]KIW90924.1 hypothetical protein Z519_08707 [Cladophialophora bantiana CBS 173.52]